MVWKKLEESAPKKAKVTISAGKVMAIVFWDCKGVLLVDYLPPNTTVNAARYCEVLTKLRAAIKRKGPGLLSRKVLPVHDNARPHATRTTQTLLKNFKWEIFTHPPYSPDLAPSDFHLFPAFKLHLGGKHFANDDEVQAEANHWLGTTVVSKNRYNAELNEVCEDSALSFKTIYYWMDEFKRGRKPTQDETRPGRSMDVTTPEMVSKTHCIVMEDRRVKICEIAETSDILLDSVHHILHVKLQMKKLDDTWMHHYTPEFKQQSKQWTV
ncbi:hypothetical protein LAZ67_19000187 [Cordylochernes scorpioides]|uniref:Transposase n=1 Tax=Cordylochernes scorpioides TaxID=51811 RepID=A0ABY6LH35_9ARAC|nr:hypothetical protein LAZ67_19000187 [Cordylochernes scorpioides]